MKKNFLKVFALVPLIVCVQCLNEVAPYPCEVLVTHEVSYSLEISPIISNSCAIPTCHVGSFPKGDFTNYDDLKRVADNGKLKFKLSNGQMPPEYSKLPLLSICDVNLIEKWINEGAKDN
jgi:hypothetical protein